MALGRVLEDVVRTYRSIGRSHKTLRLRKGGKNGGSMAVGDAILTDEEKRAIQWLFYQATEGQPEGQRKLLIDEITWETYLNTSLEILNWIYENVVLEDIDPYETEGERRLEEAKDEAWSDGDDIIIPEERIKEAKPEV